MIDLEAAQKVAQQVKDMDDVAVSGRWLRQVIRELTAGRQVAPAPCHALDFTPSPAPRR